MNVKKYLLASLAVFVFIYAFEWIFHGTCLKSLYMQTAHLWRPEGQFIVPAMLLGQILFPLIFAFIFIKGYENKGLMEGIRYGILIGLLLIPTNLIFYAVQPLPLELVLYWCVGGMVETIIAGAILAVVYKP